MLSRQREVASRAASTKLAEMADLNFPPESLKLYHRALEAAEVGCWDVFDFQMKRLETLGHHFTFAQLYGFAWT